MADWKDPNLSAVTWASNLRALVEVGTGSGAAMAKFPLGSFSEKNLPSEDVAVETGDSILVLRGTSIVRINIETGGLLDIILGGGVGDIVTSEDLAAAIEDYLTTNGVPLDFATASEILTGEDSLMIDAAAYFEAHEGVAVTPDGSENVSVDCSLGFCFSAVVDDDADIDAITNMIENVKYVIEVTASGAGRAVTATGANETINFGAGVTITSGKKGLFVMYLDDNADKIIQYAGETD